MTHLTCFGSARTDAFLELPQELAGKNCRLDTKDCFIELSYASKLPLNNVTFCTGGNGANVAVGVKRLGLESSLVAELGTGPIADLVRTDLEKEIDLSYVSQTEGINQGFGAVIVYQGERTILSYYSPKRPPFPGNLKKSDWAYLTSVGDNFEEFYDDVLNYITKNDVKLAFNPGGRQIKKGTDWLVKFLKETDILLVNREEAEEIVGNHDTHGKEKALLDSLSEMGSKINVVTDGVKGSYAKDENNKYYQLNILPIDAIERTGAGDSYSAGFLSALLNNKTVSEAMLWGTVNAASVIGYIGPESGLLRKEEIPLWLDRAKSSGIEIREL